MLIHQDNRLSKLTVCLDAAPTFHLSRKEAMSIIERQISSIHTHWDLVCDEERITEVDKKFMWRRQFLNSFALDGPAV